MAQLGIPKDYRDGDVLLEADLDQIRDKLLTFINTTKLNDDNIQDAGITASSKVASSIAADKLADESVTLDKITLANREGAIGTISLFHTFNGTLSIPRGWMKCNGDVVNETNYEAIHSSGDWTTDGVGSAALNGINLPNLESRYAVGTASTTQDGTSAITAVGESGNTTGNFQHSHAASGSHNHQWYQSNGTSSDHEIYNSSGTEVTVTNATMGSSYNTIQISTTSATLIATDLFTTNSGPNSDSQLPTVSVRPESIEFIFIIKVV